MKINNQENMKGCINSNRSKDLLMIDSKWEWKRREFEKIRKRKKNIWSKEELEQEK